MKNGAHYQYKKRQVEGVDQGTLIIMLYDGAIKFLQFAKEAIANDDNETAHNNIVRAQAVIHELSSSLKVDVGEVVVNLLRLYEFMNRELAKANAGKDDKTIDGVVRLLTSLRDGWLSIIQKLRAENQQKNKSPDSDEAEAQKEAIDIAV